MGTGDPPVSIRAATLAGGEKNQDRYAHGDGWAFVLDGASSFATVQPQHDGGWYAERLKNALVHELMSRPDDATPDIVARAIELAASPHEEPETCPTSTIAMARWTAEAVEAYVLGDSTIALIGDNDEEEITDPRLAAIAPQTRALYRTRLQGGHGFDTRHRELLRQLQSLQVRQRNHAGGFWIAGADPEAARHGLSLTRPRRRVDTIVLATDGAAAALRYTILPSWTAITSADPATLLQDTQAAETTDDRGKRWPRSKLHDDKTLALVNFPRRIPAT